MKLFSKNFARIIISTKQMKIDKEKLKKLSTMPCSRPNHSPALISAFRSNELINYHHPNVVVLPIQRKDS